VSSGETFALAIDEFLPAAPSTVFRALTDARLYERWMGPGGSKVTVQQMEPTVGGRLAFTTVMRGGESVSLEGEYLEVDPPRRLAHTWRMVGDDEVTTVTFTLSEHVEGTRLVLTHEGFRERESRDMHEEGWRHHVRHLAKLYERDRI
jgi:uncharacterized protein YndB with AHSA1/START domain